MSHLYLFAVDCLFCRCLRCLRPDYRWLLRSFAGDGSQLNNLPEAVRLLSGSASASISPSTGFLVNVSSSFNGDMDVTGDVRVTGDLYVDDRIVAREILVEIVSSSIIFSSGSNKFGNTSDDLQEFTGSVGMSGSLNVEGDISTNSITASAVSSSFFIGDGSQLFTWGLLRADNHATLFFI